MSPLNQPWTTHFGCLCKIERFGLVTMYPFACMYAKWQETRVFHNPYNLKYILLTKTFYCLFTNFIQVLMFLCQTGLDDVSISTVRPFLSPPWKITPKFESVLSYFYSKFKCSDTLTMSAQHLIYKTLAISTSDWSVSVATIRTGNPWGITVKKCFLW